MRDYHRALFMGFCSAFYYEEDDEHYKNYKLKEEHTIRVCDNVDEILNDTVTTELKDIAWISCLYHDLGRFPQYNQYRTFKDSESANHGLLSYTVLQRGCFLDDLDVKQKEIILNSVRFHNAYHIPTNITDPDTLLCLKAVRDADKLDIWKVFIDYYQSSDSDKPSAVGLGFPDTPTYSEDFIKGIYQKNLLKLSDVKTLNDFKLLQLSWVFDLNLKETFNLLLQRQYIDAIHQTLPNKDDIKGVIQFIKDFAFSKATS
ncbi:MAG: HD domain-containing protein [Thermodesulfovibrionales bacterium]|nr:HD domain-containing protein [Thermodesulfovibrionales bacterium]